MTGSASSDASAPATSNPIRATGENIHPSNAARSKRSCVTSATPTRSSHANNRGGELQILDGHLRADLDADAEVPVLVVDLTDAEADAVLATHDPIAAMATTHEANLRRLIDELEAPTTAIAQLLEDLRPATNDPSEADDLDEPEPEPAGEPTAQPGDIWILGDHRLACGDATDPELWTRLMRGNKAQACFTDPPYGISYNAPSGQHAQIAGDELRRDELAKLLINTLNNVSEHTRDDAGFYIWHAHITRDDFSHALRTVGLEERQYIIWAKPAITLGWADYQWAHEPCFYAAKAGQTPAFHGGRNQSTIWRISVRSGDHQAHVLGPGLILTDGAGNELWITSRPPKGRKARAIRIADEPITIANPTGDTDVWEVARDTQLDHPTQKPVELARRAIENSTRAAEIIIDPFAGSGSTLLAAQTLGRRCYAIDLEPHYIDVIIRRWETLTSHQAHREDPA